MNGLILYLKSFTFLDVIPEELSDPYILPRSSSLLLQSYLLIDKESLFKDENDLFTIMKYLEEVTKQQQILNINKIMKELVIEDGIFDFPADTRPGYNTSSLLFHMLIVSALAVTIYMYRNQNGINNDELQTLRLVSLFHDIGKMKEWHKHETVSSDLLKELLGKSCENEALDIVNRAAEIIISRKTEDELYKIFKQADRLASSLDRLSRLLLDDRLRPKGLKNIHNISSKLDEWEFWDGFTCEEIKEFTEEFCKNVSKIRADNPVFEYGDDDIKSNEVIICRLDFKGIQAFIHSKNLRVMNGASRTVDVVTNVLIPFYLIYKRLPAECILYFGGGNITLILPSYLNENRDSLIEECIKYFERFNIKFTYGTSFLYQNFVETNHEIDKALVVRKLLMHDMNYPIFHNLAMLCESCEREPVDILNKGDVQTKYMCRACREKFRVGNDYHFKKRIEALLPTLDPQLFSQLLENIMEYIAGHTLDEIKNGIEEYKNIAMLKIDGNILGQLMASSISLTDAYERSVRIDFSLKRSFHKFLIKLNEKGLDEYVKRIIMGTMYMGGDDALLLVPAVIALPLSLFMINEYHLNMGHMSTLSIGIAVGKPKHPLQLLKGSSEYLLDSITKKNVRQYAICVHQQENKDDFHGALAFWASDGIALSEDRLSYLITIAREEGLTSQPYAIIVDKHKSSIYRILKIIDAAIGNNGNISVEEYVDILLEKLDKSMVGLNEDVNKKLKELKRYSLTTMHTNINSRSDIKLRIIFTRKEGKDASSIYSLLLENLLINSQEDKRYIFGIYDLDQMLKVMGVE